MAGKIFDVIGIGSPVVELFTDSPYSLIQSKMGVNEQFTLIPFGVKTGTKVEVHSGGSSANTCAYLAKLGLWTGYFTKLSNDMFSHYLMDDLQKHSVDTSRIVIEKGLLGGITINLSTPGVKGHALLVSHGASDKLEKKDVNSHLDYVFSARWIDITSLTSKNAAEALAYIAGLARRKETKVFFAPSRTMITEFPIAVKKIIEKADAVAMNEEEFKKLYGDISESHLYQLHKIGVKYIFVTRGENGILASNMHHVYKIHGYEAEMRNPTGAGDCAAGIFIYGLIQDWEMKRIINYAAAAGAIHVAHKEIGAKYGNPSIEQIELFLQKIKDHPVRQYSFSELGIN